MISICIAGGSGFLGKKFIQQLPKEKYTVILISRNDFRDGKLRDKLGGCSIVVNLIGDTIAGFWTTRKKRRIYDSRVLTTRMLVEAINQSGGHVKLLLQVSGASLYDDKNIHDEDSLHYNNGFLKQVILDWEGELNKIKNSALRVTILRLGIVLDKNGGILKQMLYPFRMGIGVGVKSDDYFPFIALDDLMRVFIFCVENHELNGIVNVVAPGSVTIRNFFRELAKISNRKIVIWLNERLIRFVIGESGSLLTSGQHVIPAKLLREGFVFRYDNIEDALNRACN
jgi:hypothetical protein